MDLDALSTLHSFTTDKQKADIIMQDLTCLGGLVIVLSNSNQEIVQLSLESLVNLAGYSEFRMSLREFIGMKEQLDIILEKNEFKATKVYDLSRKLYATLYREPLQQSGNTGRQQLPRSSGLYKSLLCNKSNQPRLIVLQLQGLSTKEDVEFVREALIKVRGLISLTFNLPKKRVIIRCKPQLEATSFVQPIKEVLPHLAIHQVFKNPNTHLETLKALSLQEDSPSEPPGYLPEDSDLFTLYEERNTPTVPNSNADNANRSSWWNRAANFIESSFYW